jgi:transposase
MVYETKFYIALDVHTKKTDYVIRSCEGNIVGEGFCATTYQDLKECLEPYYHSCVIGMEACTSFYPLRDGFLHDNVTVKIANVLHIRQLIAKNDPLDAKRLSDMLRLGTFPESFIPSKEIQTLRSLVNLRHSLLQELNRLQSRIWAALTMRGVRFPSRSIFTKEGLTHLSQLVNSDKEETQLKLLHTHYKSTEALLTRATKDVIDYTKKNFLDKWQQLQEIEGIGQLVASYIIAEVWPISRFKSEKKLRRYAGVIPCVKESAGKFHGSMLPKTSSRSLLRWTLTQAAHGAIRTKSSKLRIYYNARKKRKQKTIMAVARCLSDIVFRKLSQ